MSLESLQKPSLKLDLALIKRLFPLITEPEEEIRFFLTIAQFKIANLRHPGFDILETPAEQNLVYRVLQLAANFIPKISYASNLNWDLNNLMDQFLGLNIFPEIHDPNIFQRVLDQVQFLDMLDYYEQIYHRIGVDYPVDSKTLNLLDLQIHQDLKEEIPKIVDLEQDLPILLPQTFDLCNLELFNIHFYDSLIFFNKEIQLVLNKTDITESQLQVAQMINREIQNAIHILNSHIQSNPWLLTQANSAQHSMILGLNRDLFFLCSREPFLFYQLIFSYNLNLKNRIVATFFRDLSEIQDITQVLAVYENLKKHSIVNSPELDQILDAHKASILTNPNVWMQNSNIPELDLEFLTLAHQQIDLSEQIGSRLFQLIDNLIQDEIKFFWDAYNQLPPNFIEDTQEILSNFIDLHLASFPNRLEIQKTKNLLEFKIRSLNLNLQSLANVYKVIQIIEKRTYLSFVIKKKGLK